MTAYRWWTSREVEILRQCAHMPRIRIALKLGRSEQAITHAARLYGIELTHRHRKAWPEAVKREAAALRAQGVPMREVAAKFGTRRELVQRWSRVYA